MLVKISDFEYEACRGVACPWVVQRSAQYLHKELPVRIAHRIAGFRNLPFIVGCNPTILAVVSTFLSYDAFRFYPPKAVTTAGCATVCEKSFQNSLIRLHARKEQLSFFKS